MIISHKYRFIFVKTVKTAGTSIETYLSPLCGEEDVVTPIFPAEKAHQPRNYKQRWNCYSELADRSARAKVKLVADWIKARPYRNHSTAMEIKARSAPEIWRDYTTFCVERNPWDKTISHYYMCKSRSNPPKDFEEYIARGRFCLNYPNYCDEHGNVLVDKVLRFENLETELASLFTKLNIPFEKGLNVNAKGSIRKDKRGYRELYTRERRELIGNVFAKEIALFGYEF